MIYRFYRKIRILQILGSRNPEIRNLEIWDFPDFSDPEPGGRKTSRDAARTLSKNTPKVAPKDVETAPHFCYKKNSNQKIHLLKAPRPPLRGDSIYFRPRSFFGERFFLKIQIFPISDIQLIIR